MNRKTVSTQPSTEKAHAPQPTTCRYTEYLHGAARNLPKYRRPVCPYGTDRNVPKHGLPTWYIILLATYRSHVSGLSHRGTRTNKAAVVALIVDFIQYRTYRSDRTRGALEFQNQMNKFDFRIGIGVIAQRCAKKTRTK